MRNLFRARLPRRLTLPQLTRLSAQSDLAPAEVEKWYERFIRCYTSGYVSFREFQHHLTQLHIQRGNPGHPLSSSLVRELFASLDTNNDRELNFEEFFRFNLLVNQGSAEQKLEFILGLYRRERGRYFTEREILTLLTTMFNLFDLLKFTERLPEKIDRIVKYANLNARVCWNTFCLSVLSHSVLFELFLSNRLEENFVN